ncbi:MAG: aminopeptidase [Chitinispirillia bacterium]|jgi:leucyl aminopeptidase (aminopeptidase T)
MESLESIILRKNEEIDQDYRRTVNHIKEINDIVKGKNYIFSTYCSNICQWILFMVDMESMITQQYHRKNSLEDLKKMNRKAFDSIRAENYATSYANPDYCISVFGNDYGSAFSYFFTQLREYILFVFRHMRYEIHQWNILFTEVFSMLMKGIKSRQELIELVTRIRRETSKEKEGLLLLQKIDPLPQWRKDIIVKCDLMDERYLYQYGLYISDNEQKTAELLRNYPEEKIEKLSETIVNAYFRGFEIARKDVTKKKVVNIIYNIGQERIVKSLIGRLEEKGLTVTIHSVYTTSINRQYEYDHRFDFSLYYQSEFVNKKLCFLSEAVEEYKVILEKHSGTIYFDKFGEKEFNPKQKESCLKLTDDQQKMLQKYEIERRKIIDTYAPSKEMSFCMIAFPVPEIGVRFEEIFRDTCKINMIDTIHHEKIQQKLVDELDKAVYVHIKGKGNNRTDIKVYLHTLEDRSKHTNFVNCGSDVNIPVGEVFTTPVLKNTNGILHVSETYLHRLKFKDLTIMFKDGYITDYSCSNFQSEEESKQYIQENLLFPHKTLPVGEFAIGTNTAAYVMSKKYNILPVLTALIVEKMGPHFGIGDTCFAWEEDLKTYNTIDNKEIVATDNERSILRKSDISQAYMNCHTDITLPYDELEYIIAVTEKGDSLEILKNGRFVVPGTEEFNQPLEQWNTNMKG